MNNGDNKKAQSVMKSLGDLLAIMFHVPVVEADSHGRASCFVNTNAATAAADAELNIYEPLGLHPASK